MHSTASDGVQTPSSVVRQASQVGLSCIALTDHDTLAGVAEAKRAGDHLGIRVVAGCEFSAQAPWGELHILGYFLPLDHPRLQRFLAQQQDNRTQRAHEILHRLETLGVVVSMESVVKVTKGASIGRPHIAQVLVEAGAVRSVQDAFDRYLADGGPAYVPRPLETTRGVTDIVRSVGGVTSAAHLKRRGNRQNVTRLAADGIDAVEVLHPSHDEQTTAGLDRLAARLGLLKTGGSDWHGRESRSRRDYIGSMAVPNAWLEDICGLHQERAPRVA